MIKRILIVHDDYDMHCETHTYIYIEYKTVLRACKCIT